MNIQPHAPTIDIDPSKQPGMGLRRKLHWMLCVLGGAIELLALLRARHSR